MSWSDSFPIFSADELAEFASSATSGEKRELREWFDVDRIILPNHRKQTGSHLVSTTLFWKNIGTQDPDLPKPTRYRMLHARRLGLVSRFDPWESYVEPFLLHSESVLKSNPDVGFRVYLAADLDFLVEDLTTAGWEVYLMKSSSLRHCPGSMWRFLALEDKGKLVTMIDADRIREINYDLERTRLMDAARLGLWRVPAYFHSDSEREVRYRPILGGHFGARGGLPVRRLIHAFVWHLRRGSLPSMVSVPGCGSKPLQHLEWPNYGVDEIFQLMALYPRLVRHGTLTFIPTDARSLFLLMDVEYCTWANSRSETIYIPAGGCCPKKPTAKRTQNLIAGSPLSEPSSP